MSTPLPTARILLRAGHWDGDAEICALTYEGRFLRRKALTTRGGLRFVVDLPHTESLNDGDALELDNGRRVRIVAQEEALLEVSGPDLPRLAWHIGNRHTPCQILPDRLLIQHDHVIRDMLVKLGATLRDVHRPFTPEGGAYGHGRTHSHDHGNSHHHHGEHAHSH